MLQKMFFMKGKIQTGLNWFLSLYIISVLTTKQQYSARLIVLALTYKVWVFYIYVSILSIF